MKRYISYPQIRNVYYTTPRTIPSTAPPSTAYRTHAVPLFAMRTLHRWRRQLPSPFVPMQVSTTFFALAIVYRAPGDYAWYYQLHQPEGYIMMVGTCSYSGQPAYWTTESRATCPACGRTYTLTTAGNFRYHGVES